jgi:molecular chaperone DnaJ
VRIPAGIDNGSRLRLRGEGEAGVHGGPPGDLYVVVSVEPDKKFARQGQDLVVRQEIGFVQAALGEKVEVPTLDEPVTLDIPKGTQSGEVFRLRGLGLPHPGSSHKGDLLVDVRVLTPTRLSKKQEELLREFARLEDEKPMKKAKDFFKKTMDKVMGE